MRDDDPTAQGDTPSERGKRNRRFDTIGGALILAALVIYLVAQFLGIGASTQKQPQASATTPIGSPTPVPGTGWTLLPNLSSQQQSVTLALAPSDAQVAYQSDLPSPRCASCAPKSPALQGTTDGGRTWQVLALPTQLGDYWTTGGVLLDQLAVSPLDARVVFLTVSSYVVGPCQALAQTQPPCAATFASRDSGHSWHPLSLPDGGVLSELEPNEPPLQAGASASGGQRLYAVTYMYSQTSGSGPVPWSERLVVSSDGGQTWQVADAVLNSLNQFVTSYAVDPAHGMILVTTLPAQGGTGNPTVWSSQDGGGTWTQSAAPADCFGPILATDAQGHSDFYVVGTGASVVCATTDVGATWMEAPTGGMPFPLKDGPFAGTGDGSVVMTTLDGTFFAWKPGATAWRLFAPAGVANESPLDAIASHANGQRILVATYQSLDSALGVAITSYPLGG